MRPFISTVKELEDHGDWYLVHFEDPAGHRSLTLVKGGFKKIKLLSKLVNKTVICFPAPMDRGIASLFRVDFDGDYVRFQGIRLTGPGTNLWLTKLPQGSIAHLALLCALDVEIPYVRPEIEKSLRLKSVI